MPKAKKTDVDTATATKRAQHEAVRLDAETRARVDAEEARLRAAHPTLTINRSAALRSLLLQGLDAAEAAAPPRVRRARVVRAAVAVEGDGVALGTGGPVAVKGEC